MNFEIACSNCGAISSPVVGICPFCKSVMTRAADGAKQAGSVPLIQSLYDGGKIEQALALAATLEKKDADSVKDTNFVLLYTQIQIETEAPSSKTKSLLNQSLIANPSHPDLLEYLEIVEAEFNLSIEGGKDGETSLVNIIRRSPKNVHALFLLGRYLFWVKNDPQGALRYLESCVRFRPNFIRAKACLAAVYKALNMTDVSERLMNECVAKTSDSRTKEFFNNFARS
jgi:hypothetical protein